MIICSPQLGLSPESALGGEVFDREILLKLAEYGAEIEVILPKNKKHDANVKNWSVTYVPFTHFPAILGNILYLPFLFKVHKKNKFQILRLHQPQFLALASLIFKFFNNDVKLVATYHQFNETKFGPFSKLVNRLWDHIFCDSKYVAKLIIEKYDVTVTKITVVHNGVPKYLKPATKDKKLLKRLELEDKIVLLFMGLFIKRKNPLFLLNVLKKISERNPKIILIFLGKGNLKSQIIKRAKVLDVSSRTKFIAPTYGYQKNKIHNLADIFVHPSTNEGFALAPLEAMACAKPIVMTKGYSAGEAVEDGINGFLCPPNDLNQWTKMLSKIVNDPILRKKMGVASLSKAKKEFSWDKAAKLHLEVLEKLIHERSL